MAKARKSNDTGANVGFEGKLWQAADALRNNMDAAEYKHVVLGLIFLKYISDAFEEQHGKLEAEKSQGADPEDPDEYRAVHIFWVPKEVLLRGILDFRLSCAARAPIPAKQKPPNQGSGVFSSHTSSIKMISLCQAF